MWPKDQREGKHIICAIVQVWEMTSLFVLFSFFYMKSYRNMKDLKKASDEDQCQKAVNEGVTGAAQAVESAAKNAGKFTTCKRTSVKGKTSMRLI
jgi:hypothetical protein